MPTYQYACKESACGHRFEAVQSFSDGPITVCPVCEGQVRKVFSAVGVVFKGSGFYRNDSREPVKSSNGSSPSSKDNGSGEKKKTESVPSSSSSSESSGSGSSSSGSSSKGSTTSSVSTSGSTSRAAAS